MYTCRCRLDVCLRQTQTAIDFVALTAGAGFSGVYSGINIQGLHTAQGVPTCVILSDGKSSATQIGRRICPKP